MVAASVREVLRREAAELGGDVLDPHPSIVSATTSRWKEKAATRTPLDRRPFTDITVTSRRATGGADAAPTRATFADTTVMSASFRRLSPYRCYWICGGTRGRIRLDLPRSATRLAQARCTDELHEERRLADLDPGHQVGAKFLPRISRLLDASSIDIILRWCRLVARIG